MPLQPCPHLVHVQSVTVTHYPVLLAGLLVRSCFRRADKAFTVDWSCLRVASRLGAAPAPAPAPAPLPTVEEAAGDGDGDIDLISMLAPTTRGCGDAASLTMLSRAARPPLSASKALPLSSSAESGSATTTARERRLVRFRRSRVVAMAFSRDSSTALLRRCRGRFCFFPPLPPPRLGDDAAGVLATAAPAPAPAPGPSSDALESLDSLESEALREAATTDGGGTSYSVVWGWGVRSATQQQQAAVTMSPTICLWHGSSLGVCDVLHKRLALLIGAALE